MEDEIVEFEPKPASPKGPRAEVVKRVVAAPDRRRRRGGWRSRIMTAATVTVRMLQGLAGEHIALEPGDLYETTPAQAKLWVEHGVAEVVNGAPRDRPAVLPRQTASAKAPLS